jgi:uridine kinase
MTDGLTPASRSLLDEIAVSIPPSDGSDCVLVGIDGIDGAGKTTFADNLAAVLGAHGRDVVRISLDRFHNLRSIRYRRGPHSAEGFWLDSFDYEAFCQLVLTPLGPGGNLRYCGAVHDVITDELVPKVWSTARAGSVVIVDGLFLHRSELADAWQFSVFLDVPFEIGILRTTTRDGGDPMDPRLSRYSGAQRLYFSACEPWSVATVVVDNADADHPVMIPRVR